MPSLGEVIGSISVLGTGDFGRALTKALLAGGYQVVVGSRRPHARDLAACDEALQEARVVGIAEAVEASKVVFLAIHQEAQEGLVASMVESLAGKIVVDVSNVTKAEKVSNAERLQLLLQKSMVVKAFNTQSAYSLMTGLSSGNRDVFVASDDPVAQQTLIEIAQKMGFNAMSSGRLQSSRELESSTIALFRGWGAPLVVSFIVFSIWFAYGVIRYHYIKDHEWSRVPMNTMNKAQGCTSLTLLALCYLPGCFAAFAQLVFSTKHRRFAAWLDRWLRMRKELGLLALWTGAVHAVLSVAHLNPGYFAKWYSTSEVFIPAGAPEDVLFKLSPRMTWIGECCIVFGVFCLGLMIILGITSLPSVGSRMNWRQWSFVQSSLGYICLFLGTVHLAFNACPSWGSTPIEKTAQKLSFLSMLIPLLTLFLRLLLLLPCFSIFLWKIRRGWERGQGGKDAEGGKGESRSSSKYSPTSVRKAFNFDNVGFSTSVECDLDSIKKNQTL